MEWGRKRRKHQDCLKENPRVLAGWTRARQKTEKRKRVGVHREVSSLGNRKWH